jgi:hypothetical protein
VTRSLFLKVTKSKIIKGSEESARRKRNELTTIGTETNRPVITNLFHGRLVPSNCFVRSTA